MGGGVFAAVPRRHKAPQHRLDHWTTIFLPEQDRCVGSGWDVGGGPVGVPTRSILPSGHKVHHLITLTFQRRLCIDGCLQQECFILLLKIKLFLSCFFLDNVFFLLFGQERCVVEGRVIARGEGINLRDGRLQQETVILVPEISLIAILLSAKLGASFARMRALVNTTNFLCYSIGRRVKPSVSARLDQVLFAQGASKPATHAESRGQRSYF